MSVIQTDKVDDFLSDLDADEAELLVQLVAGLDVLEIVEDDNGRHSKYSSDQMSLIGRFQEFASSHPADDDEDESDENDIEEEEEEDGDIPDTGEEVGEVTSVSTDPKA